MLAEAKGASSMSTAAPPAPGAPSKAGAPSAAPPAPAPASGSSSVSPEVAPSDPDKLSAVERKKAAEKPPEKKAARPKPASEGGQGQEPQIRDESGRFVSTSGDDNPAEKARAGRSALDTRKAQAKAADSGQPPKSPSAETGVSQTTASGDKVPTMPKVATPTKGQSTPTSLPDGPREDGTYVLGGRHYATPAEAGQAHRSLQGIHKSLQTTTEKASELARGWESAYTRDVNRLKARIAELEGGQKPGQSQTPNQPQTAPTPGQQPKADGQGTGMVPSDGVGKPFSESMDWKMFHQLYNDQSFGPTGAQVFLAQQLDQHVNDISTRLESKILKAIEAKYDPRLKTLDTVDQDIKGRQATQAARQLWSRVAQAVDENGAPYYAELAENPQLIEEVLPFWFALGPQFGMTDQGIFSAYLQWKHWRGSRQSAADDAGATAAALVAASQGGGNDGARAVVTGNGGAPPVTPMPSTPEGLRSRREQAIKEGIRNAKTEYVSSTGINLGRMNR